MKDRDKTLADLLNDLDQISGSYSATNPAHNFMQAVTALGKHGGILRVLAEESSKYSARIERLTWAMLILTVVIVILTTVMLIKM